MHVHWPSLFLPVIQSAPLLETASFLRATVLTGVCWGSCLHWGLKLQFLPFYDFPTQITKKWESCWTPALLNMDGCSCLRFLGAKAVPSPLSCHFCPTPALPGAAAPLCSVLIEGNNSSYNRSLLNAVQELCKPMRRLIWSAGSTRVCKSSKHWSLFECIYKNHHGVDVHGCILWILSQRSYGRNPQCLMCLLWAGELHWGLGGLWEVVRGFGSWAQPISGHLAIAISRAATIIWEGGQAWVSSVRPSAHTWGLSHGSRVRDVQGPGMCSGLWAGFGWWGTWLWGLWSCLSTLPALLPFCSASPELPAPTGFPAFHLWWQQELDMNLKSGEQHTLVGLCLFQRSVKVQWEQASLVGHPSHCSDYFGCIPVLVGQRWHLPVVQ